MTNKLLLSLATAGLLALPVAAQAQGTLRGAAEGAEAGIGRGGPGRRHRRGRGRRGHRHGRRHPGHRRPPPVPQLRPRARCALVQLGRPGPGRHRAARGQRHLLRRAHRVPGAAGLPLHDRERPAGPGRPRPPHRRGHRLIGSGAGGLPAPRRAGATSRSSGRTPWFLSTFYLMRITKRDARSAPQRGGECAPRPSGAGSHSNRKQSRRRRCGRVPPGPAPGAIPAGRRPSPGLLSETGRAPQRAGPRRPRVTAARGGMPRRWPGASRNRSLRSTPRRRPR